MHRNAHRPLVVLLVILIAATAIAAFTVRPEHHKYRVQDPMTSGELIRGETTKAVTELCDSSSTSPDQCQILTVKLRNGPEKGQETRVILPLGGLTKPSVQSGDTILLDRSEGFGVPATYSFADFYRTIPLLWLGLAFALVVVLVGRWRGIGALIGLAVTWIVISGFLLPSILEGNSPVVASVAAGAMICFAALYVAHGLNIRTTTALVGTLLGLVLTGVLALIAVKITRLTGQGAEEIVQVQRFAGQINVQGLLLGGIIIGSLGVLNDVTVTQASAVWEICRAQPNQTTRELYRSGMRVGRDHIASTVYTIVLAYVGAALPLLILFSVVQRDWVEVATSSFVAEEIVRTLAGSIGLVLTVPLTTALAAVAAKRTITNNADVLPEAPDNAPPAPLPSTPEETAQSRANKETTHEPAQRSDLASGSPDTSQRTAPPATNYDNGENTGTIKLQAYYNAPKAKRGLLARLGLRRPPEQYRHKMTWGERRFWGDFGKE